MKPYQYPLRIVPNKIIRYPGGREIDRFRGVAPARDDGRPEAWVGSDTRTVDAADKGDPNDGCSRCILPDGRAAYLFEVVQTYPEQMLGCFHRKKHGDRVGVLVKLLDAQEQLGLQTHPTRDYAKKFFSSEYGKEESWYVLGLREDSEEKPYVLLGFKEGVRREDFEKAYDAQDIEAMESYCHKIPVKVGDAFYIDAGAPHAIGCGCFMVEVQEPSDITVGARKLPEANQAEQEKHKQRLLGCYRYQGRSFDENLKRFRIPSRSLRSGDWGEERLIIGQGTAQYFSFSRLEVRKEATLLPTDTLQIAIVLSGRGTLICQDHELNLKQGDELFIPHAVQDLKVMPEDGSVLVMMLCHPKPIDYDRVLKGQVVHHD